MKISFEGTFPVDGFVLSNKRREISKHMLYLSNIVGRDKKLHLLGLLQPIHYNTFICLMVG